MGVVRVNYTLCTFLFSFLLRGMFRVLCLIIRCPEISQYCLSVCFLCSEIHPVGFGTVDKYSQPCSSLHVVFSANRLEGHLGNAGSGGFCPMVRVSILLGGYLLITFLTYMVQQMVCLTLAHPVRPLWHLPTHSAPWQATASAVKMDEMEKLYNCNTHSKV